MILACARCTARYDATAPAKIVFSSEVPIEAPSCWPTVTLAEATPASCGITPKVPVLMDGAITMPRPTPVRMSGPGRGAGRDQHPGGDQRLGSHPRHQHDGGHVGRDGDGAGDRKECEAGD